MRDDSVDAESRASSEFLADDGARDTHHIRVVDRCHREGNSWILEADRIEVFIRADLFDVLVPVLEQFEAFEVESLDQASEHEQEDDGISDWEPARILKVDFEIAEA